MEARRQRRDVLVPDGGRSEDAACARPRSAYRPGYLAAAGALALLLVGCGSGSSTPLPPGDPYASELPTEIPEGGIVTELETTLTALDEFVLRGTLPVPKGTFPRADGLHPFTVHDFDGTPLPTQTELVSRYPNAADGADVVEVLSRVHRDPALVSGKQVRYVVRYTPQAGPGDPGTPGPEDLAAATQELPAEALALLGDPGSLVVRMRDCFGNAYVARPLDGSGSHRLERLGSELTQLRVYQALLPEPVVSGARGTLPHFLGMHAYVSALRGSPVLLLDLRLHDGHAGADPTTTDDDPLDRVYFETLEVLVPVGWAVLQDFDDPFFGGSYTEGSHRVYTVVQPLPGGQQHVLRWQGQFHRRLALTPGGLTGQGHAYLEAAGQGFARRGTDPALGHAYWSWWHRGVGRYFPQSVQLPSLEHVGLGALRAELRTELEDLEAFLVQGTSEGKYPIASGVLGWGHPYGVAYGGMTSGNEIFLFDGVRTAESASRHGYRKFLLTHRMHTDRQPSAFYRSDGDPTRVEDWLLPNGSRTYVPFDHYQVPKLVPGDPFGFDEAQRFQIEHVEANGLQPPYEADHLAYDPHDFQHFVRYTRSAKVLAWLGNDALAKDDLRMQAENFRLSYHQHDNNVYGGYQLSGLRGAMEYVAAHPGTGFPFGRGEAWGLDCNAAAYALSDDAWRARTRPWFDLVAGTIADGQGSCTGFLQAVVSGKFAGGKYRSRQAIEQAITENMLLGLIETVYRGADAGRTALLTRVLQRSLLAFVSEMAWFPGEPAPWTYTAVAPKDLSQPPWCRRSQLPPDGWEPPYERYQNWSSFAYGHELVLDPTFLSHAGIQLGNPLDLLDELERRGTENVENRAALLSLLQFLQGELGPSLP